MYKTCNKGNLYKFEVDELNGDVTSIMLPLLVAEIERPPLQSNLKT